MTFRPYTELTTGMAVRSALMWHVVGLLLLASHILLVKQSVVMFPFVLIGMAWLYTKAPLAGLLVWLQFLLYQNWVVGLLATGMEQQTFAILQGTNFAALALLAVIAWVRLLTTSPLARPVVVVTTIALVFAVAYSIYGAMQGNFTATSIYFREATSLVLAALVGIDVGRVWGYRTIAIGFLVSVILSIGLAIAEIIAPESYYDAINAVTFMTLKTVNDPNYSAKDVVYHNMAAFFNISGSDYTLLQLRFMGTVMHPISYAYIVAGVGLIAWSIGQSAWLLVIIPLLLLSGVKGANLMFMCSMILCSGWFLTRNRTFLITSGCMMMICYVWFGISYGLEAGDFHVIGFLGGIHGFTSNPLGHGIGVGGNYSSDAASGFKWQNFQRLGADFALESAVGVLLYQMGLAAVAVFAVFIVLLKMAPFGSRANTPQRQDIIFIVLAIVAINGIFQEEAYSPYAAGLYTLLCGIIVANGRRPVDVLAVQQNMSHLPARFA